jgi:cytochrome b561/polyisoprenoid-binding protein YceI
LAGRSSVNKTAVNEHYTAVAKILHWLIAIFIALQLPLGWLMSQPADLAQKFKLFQLHKSLGITVLLLMVLRVLWRFIGRTPALPAWLPWYERVGAKTAHLALYLLLFALPLTGWALVSSSTLPIPTLLYQTIPWPHIPWLANLPPDEKKAWAKAFSGYHGILAYVLLALASLHILAALRHGLVLRDGVLSRMLLKFRRRSSAPMIVFALLMGSALTVSDGSPAWAVEWSVNAKNSKVGFEATGAGYTTKGTFRRYQAEIEFDPDEPEQASVRVRFDMRSVTTGADEVDSTLQSADYFNLAQYPTAEFIARGAHPAGQGRYYFDGQLTLKGVTRPVRLPFALAVNDEGGATVKGEATINRLDFGVGPETVAGLAIDKDVKLTLDLKALRLDN